MKFKIVAVGKIKEKYFKDAVAEYAKRISRFASVEIVEVDECTFCGAPNSAEIAKIVTAEGQRLLQKTEGFAISLDIAGKETDSVGLFETIEKVAQNHSVITFLIGGSYGLSPQVKEQTMRVSLGRITLPHQLCRVVLCEQIYRACTLKHNVPYHK